MSAQRPESMFLVTSPVHAPIGLRRQKAVVDGHCGLGVNVFCARLEQYVDLLFRYLLLSA